MTQSCCNFATLEGHDDLCRRHGREQTLTKNFVGFGKSPRLGEQLRGRESIEIAAKTRCIGECGECRQRRESVMASETEIGASGCRIVHRARTVLGFCVRNGRIVEPH